MATKRERESREHRKTNAADWAKDQAKGNFESTCVQLPKGVDFYKLETGVHQVDFMPYIAGKGNPRADEGFIHFERQYQIHRVPMPNGKDNWYCCLWECFKKPCPICKYRNSNAGNKSIFDKLKLSTRNLWIINDKPGDKKNPLKVFDVYAYNKGMGFAEMLAKAINLKPKYANFADLEKGMTVQLAVDEQSMPGRKFNAVTRIDFEPRDYDYPEDMLESAPCLDACLIEKSAKELNEILTMGGEDQGDDEPPARASRSRDDDDTHTTTNGEKEKTAEDYGIRKGDYVTYKGEEYEVIKVSGDGTSLTLEDDSGETKNAVDPSKVKKVKHKDDEDDDRPAPRAAAKAPAKAAPKDDDDDDDLDEDEDEDLVPAAKKGKKAPVDDDDDEDDPPPKKKAAVPAKAGKKAPVDDDEDDDDLDDELDDMDPLDEEDEDDEPAPKRRAKR